MRWWWWWTKPSTRRISDHSKLRLADEYDDAHIARSWCLMHKNVHRWRTGSWQHSDMPVSSAVPAWFPVTGHDLLQTAGSSSCSAIAIQTNLRVRTVQCHSASGWPSGVLVTLLLSAARTCAFFQFAAEDGLRQSVITHAQHMASPVKLSRNQECLDTRYHHKSGAPQCLASCLAIWDDTSQLYAQNINLLLALSSVKHTFIKKMYTKSNIDLVP